MVKKMRETWMKMIPKVFKVVKNESNAGLIALYEECLTCTSEGAVAICIICVFYSCS